MKPNSNVPQPGQPTPGQAAPGQQPPVPGQPAVQSGQATAAVPQPGQPTPGQQLPVPGQAPVPQAAPGQMRPATAPAPAAYQQAAAVPGRPAVPRPVAGQAPAQRPGVPRPAHAGPGTGVPNPNYQYSTKPPLLGTGLQRDILSLLIKVAIIVGIVVATFTFAFGLVRYESPSMSPAVHSGDLIMFSRFDRNYFAQDLIVVTFQGETQIRRVVAVAGDTVDFADGTLLLDGVPQTEERITTETFRYVSEIDFPLTVPNGYVFVLADHREYATDSRTYGAVPIDDTQGKVVNILRSRLF